MHLIPFSKPGVTSTLVVLRFTHEEENNTLHRDDPFKIKNGLSDSVSGCSAKKNINGRKRTF
jgi:hypothetical protein